MRDSSEKILLFIPMYGCARQIGRVLQKVYEHASDVIQEILIVDNRSLDDSRAAALAAMGAHPAVPTKLVMNTENYSLGGSHKVAFQYAESHGFSHVIALHGDDQADIRDFVALLKKGAHRNADALLGSRFMRGSELHGYSRFRRFGNAVFNGLFTVATGRRIWDMGSGLNLYSMKVIAAGDHRCAADDLTFHCYFLLTLIARRRRLAYVPIRWCEEDQVSNAKLVRQSRRILALLLLYRLTPRRFLATDHATPGYAYSWSLLAERGPS